jgi:aminopeptidase N
MWIHEGWGTYLECLYVEYMYGRDDYLKYTNAYKSKVRNQHPIVARRGVNATPPGDQYFKGALFLHTLRSVVDDERLWRSLLRDFYQRFKYRNIMTEDVVEFFNRRTGRNLTPVFDQYLRHAAIPTLELKFDEADDTVSYRWRADEPGFNMPVRVGAKGSWQLIQPTAEWKTMKTPLKEGEFSVATELYYIDVKRAGRKWVDK